MAVKCGVDIIETVRIKKAVSNERFVRRVFTSLEIEYCESRGKARAQSYAARFAAKEAVAKALGTGFTRGLSYRDIELIVNPEGAPEVRLYGKALELYQAMKARSIAVSLAHHRSSALAFVIIEI